MPSDEGVSIKVHGRINWIPYFKALAKTVSLRGDCRRSQVGAVLIDRHRRIRATGYNGAEPGGPSCLAGECPRGLQSYEDVAPLSSYAEVGPSSCISLHAEVNLMLYSSIEDRQDGTVVITREPCDPCLRMLKGSGVINIVWDESEHGPAGSWTRVRNLDGRPGLYEWKKRVDG